jgi:hypothetical protein
MDDNNINNDCNCFLDDAWYVIDKIDGNIDNANNEVDAQIIIIGGWIGLGPYAANNMWVLETLSRLEQWFYPQTRGKLLGLCNMHTTDYIQYYRKDLVCIILSL